MIRNLTQYKKQAYMQKGLFVYKGTTALKKGHGMCFDLDYVTTETDETATDNFGSRGMKVVEKPSTSNNQAFAGVLTQDYPARSSGEQLVELYLPGGCAEIAQRVASTINTGLLTCAVGTDIEGVFGHGGFKGRGSAIPLMTLTAATLGDLAFQNVAGTATAVYSSSTGLTTITMALAGTALGYVDTAIDASDYEMTVWGGATASDSETERCPSGVYPVVQATAAGTFTVTGDTGDGALTIQLVKKDLLTLAYLCDGEESGLCDYFVPETGATDSPMVSGMSIVLGGLTLDADDDAVVADGTMDGQRKGFYMLGSLTTKEMLWDITSGYSLAGTGDDEGTALSTLEMDTAEEWATLEWHHFGPSTSGIWMLTGKSGTSVACA